MEHFTEIDLPSSNSYIAIIDNANKRVLKKKAKNDLQNVVHVVETHRKQIKGIVVESICNWYWLMDGLMDKGSIVVFICGGVNCGNKIFAEITVTVFYPGVLPSVML